MSSQLFKIMLRRGRILVVVVWLTGAGCETRDPVARELAENSPAVSDVPVPTPMASIQLTDITQASQIEFRHTDGSSGKFYFVEVAASGLCTFDYDGDGLLDIYFLSGVPLPGSGPEAAARGNALYRNLGECRFQDVTQQAGVGKAGYGLGVTAGDYDNDGDQDLYISNFGPKVLFRNNGDGTFTNVAREAGVDDGDQVGAGVCFLDMDHDGDLDLYVANYVDFSCEQHIPRSKFGVPAYASPDDYEPLFHSLYRNEGQGSFTNVSQASGIARRGGPGMGVICADYDDDGATDIICANDEAANFCFHNDGHGVFTEVGAQTGLAFNAAGQTVGNMGVDCADFDHDGRLDFFVTTFQRELPLLFRNVGQGLFQDMTAKAAHAQACYNNSKWGCGFADFDNDGHKDIFVGVGHLQVNIELWDKTSRYAARPLLLRNTGQGSFEDVTDLAGDGLQVPCVARGVALDDLDNDGRIDVVISNSRHAPLILRNESRNDHHWLELQLRGVTVNRDAVGARVVVKAGDLVQLDEVHSGRGYQSHFGTRLHFGLGERDRVDSVEIRWPGGTTEVWRNILPDTIVTLTEGQGEQFP